jgi:hypothetical protein
MHIDWGAVKRSNNVTIRRNNMGSGSRREIGLISQVLCPPLAGNQASGGVTSPKAETQQHQNYEPAKHVPSSTCSLVYLFPHQPASLYPSPKKECVSIVTHTCGNHHFTIANFGDEAVVEQSSQLDGLMPLGGGAFLRSRPNE